MGNNTFWLGTIHLYIQKSFPPSSYHFPIPNCDSTPGIEFHQTLPQNPKKWETFPQFFLANSKKCSPLLQCKMWIWISIIEHGLEKIATWQKCLLFSQIFFFGIFICKQPQVDGMKIFCKENGSRVFMGETTFSGCSYIISNKNYEK